LGMEKWLETLYLYNVINLRVVRKILQKDSLKKIIMLYL